MHRTQAGAGRKMGDRGESRAAPRLELCGPLRVGSSPGVDGMEEAGRTLLLV